MNTKHETVIQTIRRAEVRVMQVIGNNLFLREEASIGHIPAYVRLAMEEVEWFPKLSGAQKKTVVTTCMMSWVTNRLVIDTPVERAIVALLPVMIESFIEVNNGKLKINLSRKGVMTRFKAHAKGWFSGGCGCGRAKK